MTKITLLLFLTCNTFFSGIAQNALNTTNTSIPFTVYKSDNDTASIHTILKSNNLFQAPNTFNKTHPKDTYWIKLDFNTVSNILKTDSLWYLKFNNFGYGSLYFKEGSKIKKKSIGLFEKGNTNEDIISSNYHTIVPFKPETLIEGRFLYLKVKQVKLIEHISNWNFIYLQKNSTYLTANKNIQDDAKMLIPLYAFAGICLIMFILIFSFFIYFKDKQYLFYSIYLLFVFVYLCGDSFGINDFLFGNQHYLKYWFSQALQMLTNISYVYFVMLFVKAKQDYLPIYYTGLVAIGFQVICLIIDSYFIYNQQLNAHIYLMHFQRFSLIAASSYGIIYGLRHPKNQLIYYICFGGLVYVLAFSGQFYFTNANGISQTFKNHNYYLIISFILEIIIFAFGFTHKILLEHNEKLRFERESFANKTKALRAQINPHFLFNSLSSIQHLITSNNKVSALKYLSKFSRLTRNVLESSIESDILLSEEIKMLNDYLELESLRFKNSFSYTINIADEVDPGAIEIPILVIQPFVENAIIHGFLNKKEDEKTLHINFYRDHKFLICEIDDNGVGRDNSIKKNSIHKKKSLGLQVTKERLELFNKLNDETNNITIVDKKTDDGTSLGTKVIIKILIR